MGARILVVGMVPEIVDFSGFPGLTAEKVRAGIAGQEQVFRDKGFEPVTCLFERLLNLVHADAPKARIAFNTSPADTVEAALRWVPPTGDP